MDFLFFFAIYPQLTLYHPDRVYTWMLCDLLYKNATINIQQQKRLQCCAFRQC
jgi:hypothetical protein